VDPEDIKSLNNVTSLNTEADSIYELHKEPSPVMEPGSIWNDFVLSPSRSCAQKELRESILKIENSIRKSKSVTLLWVMRCDVIIFFCWFQSYDLLKIRKKRLFNGLL